MQYQALYRKYRPQRFDEVVGQDHVTETLAREVVKDQVAHAYLFTGPRGTGKTTSARLLAKSLNCPNRSPDGEPCNTCDSCGDIAGGSSMDVIELDAASHNKVEDIREIRTNVGTVAAGEGALRVYILDEAHMLSRAASNALLKTLEEPPEHVVFVLATTEPYKLLDTIRSRTQRFDFHPVASETLIEYVVSIADREGFTTSHEAIAAVTRHSGGSVRDALSLLEQVAALENGSVTPTGVSRALGIAGAESYGQLLDIIATHDAAAGITLIARLASDGADLRRFVEEAIGYLRGVFLTQYSDNIEQVVDAPADTIADWRARATDLASGEVLRAIDELASALLQLREGREERVVCELAMLRLTRPETVPNLEGLTARIDRLEREVRTLDRTHGGSGPTAPASAERVGSDNGGTESLEEANAPDRPFLSSSSHDPPAPVAPAPTPQDAPSPQENPPPPGPELSLKDFEHVWPQIVAEIRHDLGPRRHALLKPASPVAMEGTTVTFEVASHLHFHLEQLKSDAGIAEAIGAAAGSRLGGEMAVVFRAAEGQPTSSSPPSGHDDERQEEHERAPDKDDLVVADDASDDAVSIVLDALGGEIVGE